MTRPGCLGNVRRKRRRCVTTWSTPPLGAVAVVILPTAIITLSTPSVWGNPWLMSTSGCTTSILLRDYWVEAVQLDVDPHEDASVAAGVEREMTFGSTYMRQRDRSHQRRRQQYLVSRQCSISIRMMCMCVAQKVVQRRRQEHNFCLVGEVYIYDACVFFGSFSASGISSSTLVGGGCCALSSPPHASFICRAC